MNPLDFPYFLVSKEARAEFHWKKKWNNDSDGIQEGGKKAKIVDLPWGKMGREDKKARQSERIRRKTGARGCELTLFCKIRG